MNHDAIVPTKHIVDVVWQWLEQAADSPYHPIRVMTLATRDQAGHPDARLMNLRGADRDSARLWMHTNPNAPKLRHIRESPRVCLVTYEPDAGVQLRLYGCAAVHTQGRIQKQHVEQSAAWLTDYDSSQSKNNETAIRQDPRSDAFLAIEPEERSAVIVASTAIIDIHLDTIDWQQAVGDHQQRFTMQARDNWTPTAVHQALLNDAASNTNHVDHKYAL